jgi:tyrosinase
MAVERHNILTDETTRKQFIEGVTQLKHEFLGFSSADLGISGPETRVSTYDLFVAWHHIAMSIFTPPSQGERNSAHGGPVFPPWHRFMLILFELQMQRVLGDSNFGLPYWDWAADGDLPPQDQPASGLWAEDCMGGEGFPVDSGPFAYDPADPNSWTVHLEVGVQTQLRTTSRGLRRSFASNIELLPTKSDVAGVLAVDTYDEPPWNTSASGFRNLLEGWQPSPPNLHNQVHVWVGGDMLVSSSPNDPVFYLNHCNVDRIWASWLVSFGATYVPDQTQSSQLLGHRIDDAMYSLLTDPANPVTPGQMLDVQDFYSYDALVTA